MNGNQKAEPSAWCGGLDVSTAGHVACLISHVVEGRYSVATYIPESSKMSLATGLSAKIRGRRDGEEVRVLWGIKPCVFITWEDGDQVWTLDASMYSAVQVSWDKSLIFRFIGHLGNSGVVRIWALTPERGPRWRSIPDERVREMMDVLAMTTRLSPYTRGVADALAWFLGEMDDATMYYKYMHEGLSEEAPDGTPEAR